MLFNPTTPEEYLATVEGWQDPNPAPVLERHEGVCVVRDDLIPGGSKSRFIDYLIGYAPEFRYVQEWVYGHSPRWGYGQLALSHVARLHGKRSTLFLAKSNDLYPNTALAASWGTTVHQVPLGFMTVCASRAAAYVAEDPTTRRMVPFGLDHETVMGSIIKVARSIPIKPDEVWSVAASGTLTRGLQLAWPNAQVNVVQVGHKMSPEERGRATVFTYPKPFATKCPAKDRPPFPSVGEYDAKAWTFARDAARRNPDKIVLLWNVAGDVVL